MVTKQKTKEEIYDEQISPLMGQIIAICKKHKIANLCTFSLDVEEDLVCTTAMLSGEFDPPPEFIQALKIIKPMGQTPQGPMMVTVTNADGSKTINAVF